MKKVTMFMSASCPYCREALRYMDELFARDGRYKAVEIEKIDENTHPEIADKYDYYYIPTYYVGDVKLHEGAASLEKVKRVFDAAVE